MFVPAEQADADRILEALLDDDDTTARRVKAVLVDVVNRWKVPASAPGKPEPGGGRRE